MDTSSQSSFSTATAKQKEDEEPEASDTGDDELLGLAGEADDAEKKPAKGKGKSKGSGKSSDDGDNEDPNDDAEMDPGAVPDLSSDGPGAGKGAGSNTSSPRILAMQLLSESAERVRKIFSQMAIIEAMLRSLPRRSSSNSQDHASMLDYGSDLENVITSELALLAHPDTQLDFLTRYSENSLLINAPPQTKRFPVIIEVDGSGSMKGDNYDTALAFSLAMLKILAEEKRGVAVMNFSGSVTSVYVMAVGAKLDPLKVLEVLLNPTYGGTDFDSPLHMAFDIRDKYNWRSILSVIVTDGECSIRDPEAINNRKHGHDKIFGVVTEKSASGLSPVADEVALIGKNGMMLSLIEAAKAAL